MDNFGKRLLHKLARDLKLPKLTFQVIRRTIATLAQKKGKVKDVWHLVSDRVSGGGSHPNARLLLGWPASRILQSPSAKSALLQELAKLVPLPRSARIRPLADKNPGARQFTKPRLHDLARRFIGRIER